MTTQSHYCRVPITASALLCALSAYAGGTNNIPASLAGAAGSYSNRGFIVRAAQAAETAEVNNNYIRAIRQLNGTLTDSTGAAIADESTPGPESGGAYYVDTINFERDGNPFDVIDGDGVYLWSFTPGPFPGIPGAGGHTKKFAVEAVAYVELPLGATTFGVSVGTDRTDVNDDDGYEVYVGANPRDFLAQRVASFERSAPAFRSDTHAENTWTVVTTQAGIYPFRITYCLLADRSRR